MMKKLNTVIIIKNLMQLAGFGVLAESGFLSVRLRLQLA